MRGKCVWCEEKQGDATVLDIFIKTSATLAKAGSRSLFRLYAL